jgi:hypothetical protein
VKKAEEERVIKGEKRKSTQATATVPVAVPVAVVAVTTSSTDHEDLYRDPTPVTTPATSHAREADPTPPTSPTSPSSSKGLKSIFSKLKRRSKHTSAGTFSSGDVGKEKETGFVGGAMLRSSTSQPSTSQPSHTSPKSVTSGDEPPRKLSDVEPTRAPHADEVDSYSDVSSMSNYEEPRGRSTERVASKDTEFEEAQDHFDEALAPPPTFTIDADRVGRGSPNRDSKFHEVGI